jgi:hypothetical protein
MDAQTDWIFADGVWLRTLGRRRLTVRRSDGDTWLWRVESDRKLILDDGVEDSLDDATKAAEERGRTVQSFRCHATLRGGGGMEWWMDEDDVCSVEDIGRASIFRF